MASIHADLENSYFRGVPGIVIAHNGVYTYGPTRESLRVPLTGDPRDYPIPSGVEYIVARQLKELVITLGECLLVICKPIFDPFVISARPCNFFLYFISL